MQRRFAYRAKFQKFFNDRGEIEVTLGTRLAFPAGKSNSVEIAYISNKNVRYTFDKSSEKIDERVLVPSPMLRLAIFSASLTLFF